MLFSEEQLNNNNFFEEIKAKCRDFIDYDQFREAYDLAKILELSIDNAKGFKDRNYELYRSYEDIIIKLRWVGLPLISENSAVDYFQNHLTKIFKISGYDFENLWRKLKSVLLGIMVFKERDKLKRRLAQALLNNQERITSRNIIVNNQEKPPTVADWLRDYFSILGTGRVNRMDRTQYLINGKNTKDLSEQEKNKVKLLFDLYERLKPSSFTLEGVEEEIPVDDDEAKGIIIDGVFEPYKESEEDRQIFQAIDNAFNKDKQPELQAESEADEDLAELRRLAVQYPPGSLERKAVEEEIERVTRSS